MAIPENPSTAAMAVTRAVEDSYVWDTYTEKFFENSFNVTIDRYRALLKDLSKQHLELPNDNFDGGEVTTRGKYN